MAEPGSPSAARPARAAREVLSSALRLVQLSASTSPLLQHAIGELAAASSALYGVENEASTEEAAVALLRSAVDQLTRALARLQEAKLSDRSLEVPVAAAARALAMLYPLSHASARQRRGVIIDGAISEREVGGQFAGPERRKAPDRRVFFEVDIGLLSESNFYAGLACDVSSGGGFVSTYHPAATGSEVTLFFVLPSGQAIEAPGIVRWTRLAGEDTTPGMGVAFTQLKPEDLAAIVDYCAQRAPLYYEVD